MKNNISSVLLIGGCGYIGSALFNYLTKKNFHVDTVDLEWFGNFINPKNIKKNYSRLSSKFLKSYDVVILLAGHSSIPMSEKNALLTFRNNVHNFLRLLEKLESQKFIYASSSSVYGNTKQLKISEDYDRYSPTNYYDLTKKEIDYYAQLSPVNYFGLRMGTVCGYSPNLRVDVMINKMFESALNNGEIIIFNKNFHRPILGINDFCRVIETIIKKSKPSGLYNVASFNTTIEEIANTVAKRLGGVKVTNIGENPTYYNFSVSTKKFQDTFKFKFNDTIDSILSSLIKKHHLARKSIRA